MRKYLLLKRKEIKFFIFPFLFLIIINLIYSLPNDANNRINFNYPVSVNYSSVNVNNSNYLDGIDSAGFCRINYYTNLGSVAITNGTDPSDKYIVLAGGNEAGYFVNGNYKAYLSQNNGAGYFTDGLSNVYMGTSTTAIGGNKGSNYFYFGANPYDTAIGSFYNGVNWVRIGYQGKGVISSDGVNECNLTDGTYAIKTKGNSYFQGSLKITDGTDYIDLLNPYYIVYADSSGSGGSKYSYFTDGTHSVQLADGSYSISTNGDSSFTGHTYFYNDITIANKGEFGSSIYAVIGDSDTTYHYFTGNDKTAYLTTPDYAGQFIGNVLVSGNMSVVNLNTTGNINTPSNITSNMIEVSNGLYNNLPVRSKSLRTTGFYFTTTPTIEFVISGSRNMAIGYNYVTFAQNGVKFTRDNNKTTFSAWETSKTWRDFMQTDVNDNTTAISFYNYNLSTTGNIYANDYITTSKVADVNDGELALDKLNNMDEWLLNDKIQYDKHYAHKQFIKQIPDKVVEKKIIAEDGNMITINETLYKNVLTNGLSMETRVAEMEKMIYELKKEICILNASSEVCI